MQRMRKDTAEKAKHLRDVAVVQAVKDQACESAAVQKKKMKVLQERKRLYEQQDAVLHAAGRQQIPTQQHLSDMQELQALENKFKEQASSDNAMDEGRHRGSHFRRAFEAMTKSLTSLTALIAEQQPAHQQPRGASNTRAVLDQLDNDVETGTLNLSQSEYDQIRMSILLGAYATR